MSKLLDPSFEIGARPRRVLLMIVILSGLSAQSIIFTIASPVVSAMAHYYAGAAYVLPLLFALPSLGLMLVGVVSGWLLDHAGMRLTLIASLVLYGVMGSVPLVTGAIPALLISRFLLGAACAALSTSCTMLLVISYEDEERSKVLGYQSGTGSIAGLAALIASGGIAGSLGWHVPFALYFLSAAPLAVIAFFTVAKSAPPASIVKSVTTASPKHGALTVIGVLWPVYLAICLLFIIPMASSAALPVVLQLRGITDSFQQSLIISPFTIFAAAGAFLFGRVHRRCGSRNTFVLGLALSGIGMILIGSLDSIILTLIGQMLAGLGLGLYIPHLWTVATTALPDPLRGRAAGLMNTAMYLGGFTSPFILNTLNRAFGNPGAFTAIGVIALLSIIGMFAKRSILTGAEVRLAAVAGMST